MSAKHKRPFYVFAVVAVVCCLILVSGWNDRAPSGPGGEPGSPVASSSFVEIVNAHVLRALAEDPEFRDTLKSDLISQAGRDRSGDDDDAPGDSVLDDAHGFIQGAAGRLPAPAGPPDHDLAGPPPGSGDDGGEGVRLRGSDGDDGETDEETETPGGESTGDPGDDQGDQPGDEQSDAPEDEETDSNVDPMVEDEDPTDGGEGGLDQDDEQVDPDAGVEP